MTEDEIIQGFSNNIIDLLGQPRVSLLIGAGCSICAGLPLMDTLTSQVCACLDPSGTSDPIEKQAYELLKEIHDRYSGALVSIEDFLSEIQDIDAILRRQVAKGIGSPEYNTNSGKYSLDHTQVLLKSIKERIREILGGEIKTIDYHRRFCRAIHSDLIKGRKRTKHPVNYFILNYDTLFEDALALESISFNDGFVGGATAWWDHLRFGGEEYSLGGGRVLEARVYKLHGSIDWIKPEQCEYPIRLRANLPHKEVVGDGEPVVIYPSSTKYKETQYDPYAQMMMSFRKYLTITENHVLAIMGYGFNDEHINIEVRDAIKNSNGALSVVVFLGEENLPQSLKSWLSDERIKSQILVLGKYAIWKDGIEILRTSKTLEWYRFEFLSDLLGGMVK